MPGVTCPLKIKLWVQAPSGVIAKVTGELLRFSASTSSVGEAVANVVKAASALARTLIDTFARVSKVPANTEMFGYTIFVDFDVLEDAGNLSAMLNIS